MASEKNRLYRLDGDNVEVIFTYDEETGKFFGNYPDFTENPRITPNGRKWVNVMSDGCPYADKEYGDCGSCPHFRSENPGDLIGICENDKFLQSRKEEVV